MDCETLLDELMKEEYERTAKVEYDNSPYLECYKEEDDFIVKSEDFKCKIDLSECSKEENDFILKSEDFKCKTDPLESFKEEEELGEHICNDSTFSENEFCNNSGNIRMSLFELLKKENEDDNDDDDEMYDYYNEIMSYEDELNMQLENDKKSCLSELINIKKLKSETQDPLTESCNHNNDPNSEDYKLPFFDEDYATSFLINKNLLANRKNYKCHKCGSNVKYYTRLDRGKRRKVLRCKKKGCQTTQSIRKNNSFWSYVDKNGRSISKLSISAQLELVYYWCQDFSATTIAAITGKSSHTVYNWMNLCQEVPLRMFNKRRQFGGPETVIRIDYYSLASLKEKNAKRYKRFDYRLKSYWVYVLYNAYEERYFLIDKKDKTAIHNIIKQEITVGSILHFDSSMECKNLTEFGYSHLIINNNELYAYEYGQKRERLWMPLMLFYKCRRNITLKHLSSFLIETWWRGLNKSDTFNGFLRDLAIVF